MNKKNRNLPNLIFFSDRKKIKNIFQEVKKLPKNSAVIIREYDLSFAKRLEFIVKIRKNTKNKVKILVAKDLKLALKAKADGLHCSDRDDILINRKYLNYCRKKKDFLLSYSCHSENNLRIAQKFDTDILLFSPIFKTSSHPKGKIIGLNRLAKISQKYPNKIWALGGINQKNFKLLKNLKIAGIGFISYLLEI